MENYHKRFYKFIVPLLIFIFTSFNFLENLYCQEVTIEWEKTYSGEGGRFVQKTSDGGYIVCGSYGSQAYLLKTDAYGNQDWERYLGDTGYNDAYCVRQTTDGGYIFCGQWRPDPTDLDMWLVKTNSYGYKVWDRSFSSDLHDRAYCVQQTTDGGFILTGMFDAVDNNSDNGRLIKTDSDGNQIWSRNRGKMYSVQQTTDGGYILCGVTTSYGSGKEDASIQKTDANGNHRWSSWRGGTDSDYTYCTQQTSDGGYIFCGVTKSYGEGAEDAWLIKFNSNGYQEWQRTFGGTGYDIAKSVQQTIDGGYIICGHTESEAWLIKTDVNGDKVWDSKLGYLYYAECVQEISSGEYILTGYRWLGHPGIPYSRPFLMKVKTTENSPHISRNPSTLNPTCNEGENAANDYFEVWNSGGGTLSYSISDNVSWLYCSPTSGTSTGEHDQITVYYNTSNLSADNYSATITISSSNADNNPQTIAVNLTVRSIQVFIDEETVDITNILKPYTPDRFDIKVDLSLIFISVWNIHF